MEDIIYVCKITEEIAAEIHMTAIPNMGDWFYNVVRDCNGNPIISLFELEHSDFPEGDYEIIEWCKPPFNEEDI